uniref:Uncharacterized protein n=1 Tax=Oryza barthii TaxID=65489 RepID=A0A0D3GKA7_9ORYZ
MSGVHITLSLSYLLSLPHLSFSLLCKLAGARREGGAATAAGGGGVRARRLLRFLCLLVPLGRRGLSICGSNARRRDRIKLYGA